MGLEVCAMNNASSSERGGRKTYKAEATVKTLSIIPARKAGLTTSFFRMLPDAPADRNIPRGDLVGNKDTNTGNIPANIIGNFFEVIRSTYKERLRMVFSAR